MKLAVMQPYFMPYFGYFQLMAAVDTFAIYDDVAFIKRGWINRNRILSKGEAHFLALPLRGASQNRMINEIELVDSDWREKLLKTLRHAYRRAPYFDEVFPFLEGIISFTERQLVTYLGHSLGKMYDYLEIKSRIVPSSVSYQNQNLKGEARILDICRQEKATKYLNASGGRELYDSEAFRAHGVTLSFLGNAAPIYEQFGGTFVPGLSIIDVLMFNPRKKVQTWLSSGFSKS